MKLHSILAGAVALPLLAIAPSHARQATPAGELNVHVTPSSAMLQIMPEMAGSDQAPVQLAQASDPRVVGLEEQIRQLNGRIEEMNFQILQIQEQMRKMQEDVDFRLQEMEQKRSDMGTSETVKKADAKLKPPVAATGQPQTVEQAARLETPPPADATAVGEPERQLGTIVFDEAGNVKGGTMDRSATVENAAAGADETGTDDQKVAALPSSDNPGELYRDSYEYVLSGDYGTAEAGFRKHIERYPADPQTADARYWLGEALLGQQRYRDAAEIFVEANREFPDSRKSPDMLLKLGVSLSALNQRDVACATFGKIGDRYPKASKSLKERVKQERALAGC